MKDKQYFLEMWAGELLNIKAQLLQVSWLLQQGVPLSRAQQVEFDALLDRKNQLERLIEEVRKEH